MKAKCFDFSSERNGEPLEGSKWKNLCFTFGCWIKNGLNGTRMEARKQLGGNYNNPTNEGELDPDD